MDITQLKTFLAIVETGSFSAAGEKLNSVQSNVTSRIRKLETHLGGPVFVRGRAGARLTPLGERLVQHAQNILAQLAAAEMDLKDAAGGAAPLRLGALETTAGSRLPPILKALNQKCPRALVTLNTGPSGMLMQKVWNRQLDAAFVVGPVDLDRFRSKLAFVETLVKTEASEPSNEAKTLLAFPEGCSYRAAARQWLTAIGQSDTPVRDLGSLDAILGCVGAGMGFAIVPESAINTYNALDTLRWAPLTEGFDRSETHLIWRHDTTVTRTLETLFEIIAASE